MSVRKGLLEVFSSPIGMVIAGSVLAGSIALFKGPEIAEAIKPVKTTLSNFFEFANQSANQAPEKKVPVTKPVKKATANPFGLSNYEDIKNDMK